MASALEDAFASVIIADISNPMSGVMPQLAEQHIVKQDLVIDQSRVAMMQKLGDIIDERTASNGDPKVIAAFQRMLDKYNAQA
jgi:hypothetical protein